MNNDERALWALVVIGILIFVLQYAVFEALGDSIEFQIDLWEEATE